MLLAISSISKGISTVLFGNFKRYLVLPILSILTLSLAIGFGLSKLVNNIDTINSTIIYLKTNWAWVYYFVSTIGYLFLTLVSVYLATIISPIILSPIFEPYAVKVAKYLDPSFKQSEISFFQSICRDVRKIKYFMACGIIIILCALLSPLTAGTSGLIGFTLAAWLVVAEYLDYVGVILGLEFSQVLAKMKQDKVNILSMGFIISFMMGIPVLNLLTPFIAIAACLNYWNTKSY